MKYLCSIFLLLSFFSCNSVAWAEGEAREDAKSTDTVEPAKAPTAEQELFGRVRGAHLRAIQRGSLAMAGKPTNG